MLGLVELGEQDPAAPLLRAEILDRGHQRLLDHVVGEHYDDAPAAPEPLREPERLGDAARLVLVRVKEPVDPVLVPVAEQPEELAGVRPAGDEHQLRDVGLDERFDRPVHHRPVVDGQQVLVRDPRERVQPRAGATGEDHAFERHVHRPWMLRGARRLRPANRSPLR